MEANKKSIEKIPVMPKILKKDKKGNYDIDGVSYCGTAITVAGGTPISNKTDSESENKNKMSDATEKLDRQKNLNYYAD